MRHEGTTAQLPGTAARAPGVAGRRGLILVLVRAVLALAWVVFTVNAATAAEEATVADFEGDLLRGRVTAVEVVRADPDDGGQGSLGLRWDAGLVDSFARYEYDQARGVDEVAPLLAQARADGVPVHVVLLGDYPETVTAEGTLVTMFGPWVSLASLLVIGVSVMSLITSPQPWFATKWAWFWLVWAVPVLWVAFFVLEPRPLRLSARLAAARVRPTPLVGGAEQRLTGGWAVVIAWLLSMVLTMAGLPVLTPWH